MARLTEKEASGKWQVKGIPWEELQEGAVITKETSQRLYGCLCKLKDYEDTGMDPDQLGNWKYELEDMAAHVCDDLCCHRQAASTQEELNRICNHCPMDACIGKLLELKKHD